MSTVTAPDRIKRPRAGGKGEARRESIMDAAEEIFSDKGYYGSSMRDISQRSGAALGLITHYFAAKDALFRDVIDRKRGLLEEVIGRSIDKAMARPDTSIASIIRAFVEPFVERDAFHAAQPSTIRRPEPSSNSSPASSPKSFDSRFLYCSLT